MSLAARKIRLIMQLRQAGVADTAVLRAIEQTPREHFVPEAFADQAYEATTLPIGHGQTLSAPDVVARMTQALRPDTRAKVLEVGSGSGYQAAVLARLSRRVYTVERDRTLLAGAQQRWQDLGLHNITAQAGDGWRGWPGQAPFARIIVTAAAAEMPARLVDQLAEGGVLVVPVGARNQVQELLRMTRDATGATHEASLGPVRFVPLVQDDPGAQPGRAAGPSGPSLA